MAEIKPIYVIGGVGAVVVVLLLLRRSGSSGPTVITAPAATQTADPNAARLGELAINADMFKNLTGLVYQQRGADSAARVGLAQIEASRQVGLAQTQAASNVAAAQITAAGQQANLQAQMQSNNASLQAQLQTAAINAAQAVGLAQAQADISRQQMQNDAMAAQQAAQNRNTLLQGLMSQIGNVLRAIGTQQQQQQQQPKPTSGGASGGSSSGGSGSSAPTIRTPTRLAPRLPRNPLTGIFDFTGPGGPLVDYGNVDLGFPGIDALNPSAPQIPIYSGGDSGGGGFLDWLGDIGAANGGGNLSPAGLAELSGFFGSELPYPSGASEPWYTEDPFGWYSGNSNPVDIESLGQPPWEP